MLIYALPFHVANLSLPSPSPSLITSWKQNRKRRGGGRQAGGTGWRSVDQLVSCQFDVPDACGDLSNMLYVLACVLARSLDRYTQSE